MRGSKAIKRGNAMARQLRIEYRGAYYHVKSRGNQKQPLFFSDDDRYFFLACLEDAHTKFGAVIHVYCLMTNHYHLLLETPRGRLSRIMHLINTRYSIYLNTKYERCGHPFQGRFKATLVEAERYARELFRYIHLNPVRAGMVSLPQNYEWSSFPEYLGSRKAPRWMETAFILSLFGSPPDAARDLCRDFVISAVGLDLKNPLSEAASSAILGSHAFIEEIKKDHIMNALDKPDPEVPDLGKLASRPGLARIRDEVGGYLGAKNKYARHAAIFIAHRNTDYTLGQIGEFFEIGPSGISSACRKMRSRLRANESLVLSISEIEKRLFRHAPSKGRSAS